MNAPCARVRFLCQLTPFIRSNKDLASGSSLFSVELNVNVLERRLALIRIPKPSKKRCNPVAEDFRSV